MSKQEIMHCFINIELKRNENGKEITTDTTFHFSVKASEERLIKDIGAVCSGLLQHLGIKHDVNFCYKPMYERNYFVDGAERLKEGAENDQTDKIQNQQ